MSLRQRTLLCLLVVLVTSAITLVKAANIPLNNSHGPESLDTDAENYRLPKNVLPTKYTIRLEPNIVPDQFTFKGEIEIEIDIPGGTSTIVLHAASLVIEEHHTELLYANASKVNVSMTPAYDEKMNFYKLNLSSSVSSGNYTLKMKYSGLLHRDMSGFYVDSYVNGEDERVWFAATIFSPISARRAFPCFDEPSFKATFKIFITHSNTYTAISNMPVVSKIRPADDATKWTTEFQETPKMSTYLVAFFVSDFEHSSNSDESLRVFARSNKLHLGGFAQGMLSKAIAEMANYTKIDYKLPKLDNIAIPNFPFSGLENWGLIEYRESYLLYDENDTSTETKQKNALILSHECAHQWFGDLVTPSWWSFNWLSEGFATYFGYWITHQVKPSWRVMDQFVIEILQNSAFAVDDNKEQIPMDVTTKLNDTSKIFKAVFNEVTYFKASCVIRMFVHVLTPTVFQTGLQNYLRNKSYQATTSDDLIRELAAVGQDIKFLDKALVSWITQPGYPVITVMRDYSTGRAVISQKRFLTKGGAARTEQWFVPINIVSKEEPERFSDTKPTHWLLNDTETLILSGLKNDSWIILNSQQTGYYRVNYDAKNWQLITDYLMNPNTTKNIHVLNRAQLLDDSFHLAQAGELPDHSIFLEITKYLQHEEDYIPWYAAHRAFAVLNRALMNTASYDLYKLYVQRLLAKVETKLGYTENNDENDDAKLNRLNAIDVACAMGSVKCLAATHEMLIDHVLKFKKTSADLQRVVLCAGMRSANRKEWEEAYNYTTRLSSDSDEHRILINALGCSPDPEILKMYLEKGFFVRSNVEPRDVFPSVKTGDVAGGDAIFAFIKDKFQSIIDKYSLRSIGLMLAQIADGMTTQEQATRLQNFIDTFPAEYLELAHVLRNLVVNTANRNIESSKKYENTAAKFLKAQNLVGNRNSDKMQQNL